MAKPPTRPKAREAKLPKGLWETIRSIPTRVVVTDGGICRTVAATDSSAADNAYWTTDQKEQRYVAALIAMLPQFEHLSRCVAHWQQGNEPEYPHFDYEWANKFVELKQRMDAAARSIL